MISSGHSQYTLQTHRPAASLLTMEVRSEPILSTVPVLSTVPALPKIINNPIVTSTSGIEIKTGEVRCKAELATVRVDGIDGECGDINSNVPFYWPERSKNAR
jgi:hypothetical protein